MHGLEQTFYIMGIVYMAIMFLIMVAIVVAIFAIKAKIHHIEQQLSEKLSFLSGIVSAGEKVINVAKRVVPTGKP